MNTTGNTRQHRFHIPVMGIGFTIDTPIFAAPYGIDSAISLVNDEMIESARAYHSASCGLGYRPIKATEKDARARRITSYLNLVGCLVAQKTRQVAESSWQDPQGISRYFSLLPDDSVSKRLFLSAYSCPPESRPSELELLRGLVVPGAIDVNIMTKLDGQKDARGQPLPPHESEAHAALRGFAESQVEGSLILSAGANPSLFAYLGEFADFFPDERGHLRKRIVLKVSDFRSAHVQGRMLARRGLWVSEYRIESGVNCGGHAFPTDGVLLGPILEEFKERRSELSAGLIESYRAALAKRGLMARATVPPVRVTVQGGIGTADEARLCEDRYGIDGTGWGSPFLMVPEVVRTDDDTLQRLSLAEPVDVTLSRASPLGIRLWWLRTCDSESARRLRIVQGHPGSVCPARHLALNEEFGEVPLCPGSRAYQSRKRKQLNPEDPQFQQQLERLQAPACICVDLCGSALRVFGAAETPPVAVCPGPNIVNFQRRYTLDEMVDHIYGRKNVLTRPERPHMLLREAELYLELFETDARERRERCEPVSALVGSVEAVYSGLCTYRALLLQLPKGSRETFSAGLAKLAQRAQLLIVSLLGESAAVHAERAVHAEGVAHAEGPAELTGGPTEQILQASRDAQSPSTRWEPVMIASQVRVSER